MSFLPRLEEELIDIFTKVFGLVRFHNLRKNMSIIDIILQLERECCELAGPISFGDMTVNLVTARVRDVYTCPSVMKNFELVFSLAVPIVSFKSSLEYS